MGYILDMVDKLVFSGQAYICRLEQSPRSTKSAKIPSKPVGEGLGPPVFCSVEFREEQAPPLPNLEYSSRRYIKIYNRIKYKSIIATYTKIKRLRQKITSYHFQCNLFNFLIELSVHRIVKCFSCGE